MSRLRALLGVYSRPDRDPRGQTVSVVYIATGTGSRRRVTTPKRSDSSTPARTAHCRSPSTTPRSLKIIFSFCETGEFLRRGVSEYRRFQCCGAARP